MAVWQIPTKLPANANETMKASELGVCVGGSILVVITVMLRYIGRWILQRRMNEGRGKQGERIWGTDDCRSPTYIARSMKTRVSADDYSFQHPRLSILFRSCQCGLYCDRERNGYSH